MASLVTSLFVLITTFLYCNVIPTLSANKTINGLRTICYGDSLKVNNVTNLDFQDNVRSLLSALTYESSSLHPSLSYDKTSVGRVPSRAYGSYLCRGDLNSKQCHNCLMNLTRSMSDLEMNNSKCIRLGQSLRCFLRYSNTPKFSIYEQGRVFTYQSIGTKNASMNQEYNETLSNSMQALVTEASSGHWSKANFATRVVELPRSHEKIYMLVQCATDISASDCSKCLGELYSHVPDCCSSSHGGILVHANCMIKYDNTSFFGKGCHNFKPRYLHVMLFLLLSMYITCM